MKIAVIGAGAMGSIYGGRLSLHNEVYVIDKNEEVVNAINSQGLHLEESAGELVCHPKALIETAHVGHVDLIILFVKAMFSAKAIEENMCLVGDNTYIMTLQNGCGHEEIIQSFIPAERIIIGTTEDNGAALAPGHVKHGGTGKTNIGMPAGNQSEILSRCKEAFDTCGFNVCIHETIQQLIWDKLFTNVSLSAVTAVLQVPMGYIAQNQYAWNMTLQLIREAIAVARALHLDFDEQTIIERVKTTSINSPEGRTSIYMDIHNGRKTEVDTISGAVVQAAEKAGVKVPTHTFVLNMVHALEQKERII